MIVRYVLSILNSELNPIKKAKLNDKLWLRLEVQDMRPNGQFVPTEGLYAGKTMDYIRGVYAAYCDVAFERQLLRPVLPTKAPNGIMWQYPYINGKSAVTTSAGIRWLGAFSAEFGGTGTDLIEVCRVPIVPIAIGKAHFKPVCNSMSPAWQTLVYGNLAAHPPENSEVVSSQIALVGCELTIVS